MKTELRPLNKLLKEGGLSVNHEVTRYRGKYHLLYICKNGNPVPYVISKDATDISDYIERIANSWSTHTSGLRHLRELKRIVGIDSAPVVTRLNRKGVER